MDAGKLKGWPDKMLTDGSGVGGWSHPSQGEYCFMRWKLVLTAGADKFFPIIFIWKSPPPTLPAPTLERNSAFFFFSSNWSFFSLAFSSEIWKIGISTEYTWVDHLTSEGGWVIFGLAHAKSEKISCTQSCPEKKTITHERVWKKFAPIPNTQRRHRYPHPQRLNGPPLNVAATCYWKFMYIPRKIGKYTHSLQLFDKTKHLILIMNKVICSFFLM